MSDSRTSHLPPLKKSYVGGDSNPEQPAGTEDSTFARELARYKVDIATLSETRFSEQGQLEKEPGLTQQMMEGYKKMKEYLQNDPQGQKASEALKSLFAAMKQG
ncbi:unnamed protein product [Schistocephalus solidus]|uniref:Chemotaxis protein n=1 Tax=Schistocephalus solidus TaxID=70667 RepID=A0A183SR23_SCHSO|nr:unnamed protein product [Schistocephalus solidus]